MTVQVNSQPHKYSHNHLHLLLPEEVVIGYLMMTAKLHFQPVKSTTRRIIQLC